MLKFFCSLLSFILVPNLTFGKGVRTIEATEDTIIPVKTALGYSTVLSFSTKPNSAILGDQDSFKLEYVGNSITLKPLIAHATSNLFVFTPYERFNITLKTGTPLEADYHLKLTTPRTAIPIEATATQSMKDHPYPKPSPQGDLNRSEWNGISLGCFLSSQVLGDSQQRVTLFEVNYILRILESCKAAVPFLWRESHLIHFPSLQVVHPFMQGSLCSTLH